MTAPLNNLTDTWNNAGTIFVGLKYNITNTASAAASLLFDFQLGGVSKANIGKSGSFNLYNTNDGAGNYERGVFDWTTTSNVLTIGAQNLGTGSVRNVNFVTGGGGQFLFNIAGTTYATIGASGFAANSGVIYFQGGPGNGILSADGSTTTIYVGSSSVGGGDFSGTLKATTVTLNDVSLTRGATGVFKFGSSASFSANGSVATTMTSLGPSAAHTTIQKWLTIQDSGGGTLYIPCY